MRLQATQEMIDDSCGLDSFVRNVMMRDAENEFTRSLGVSLSCSSDDYQPQIFSVTSPTYRVSRYVTRPMKTYCQWCHGETVDDMRGNCSACGASRGGRC